MTIPLKLYRCLIHGLKMCILFFHKMNSVIFAAKVNRYNVSCVFSCFMKVHIFKVKQKVAGDINSLNLLVLLISVIMPTIVGILTFMSRMNFMLS